MPEEESGFTFVDKRRAPVEPGGEEPVSAPEPVASVGETEDFGSEERPDIYGVIGYCLSLLSAEAWQKMGLIADPQTGEATPDLAQAKVAIDAAGDLAARLEAAPVEIVPDSLRRDLRTLMNDLRLNYVAQRDQSSSITRP